MHGHVIPRQAHDPLPCEFEIGVAGRVPLAVAPRAVKLEAVELYGKPVLWPEGVDLVGGCLSLNCGIEAWGP